MRFLDDTALATVAAALRLSARERQIVHMVLADRSELYIATELNISTHTVHSHLERLYRKLAVRSRCQLLIRVFETYVELVLTAGLRTGRHGGCTSLGLSAPDDHHLTSVHRAAK